MRIKIDNKKEWRGYYQFFSIDNLGNEGRSYPIFIGIDLTSPIIEYTGSKNIDLTSNMDINISYRFSDMIGSGVDQDSIRYRIDNNNEDWSEWFIPDQDTEQDIIRAWFEDSFEKGVVRIQFMASDIVGNIEYSDILDLNISDPIIDLPPDPVIFHPKNGSIFSLGQEIVLDAFGTTDDGLGEFPEVLFTWISSKDGILGNGNKIKVRLSNGSHRIYLYADDGSPGHNVSTWVDIEVIDDGQRGPPRTDPSVNERSKNFWFEIIVITITAIALLAAAIGVVMYHKRKESEVLQMGIKGEGDNELPDLDELF